METNEEIEMQLWEYIDGSCSIDDMQRISILIERDATWKQKYEELSAFNSGISNNLELDQPSMRFTQNVMEAVAKVQIAPATKKYINKGIIRGIAALFIVMLATILGYAIATAHTDAVSAGTLSRLDLNKANIAKYINSTTINVIIAINIVIGLTLLDTILRRKSRQHSN